MVSGPSGVGKGTLVARLREQEPGLGLTVSATTRAPREGEVEGTSYYFLTEDEFDRRVAAGEFLEWAHVHGHRYGTLRAEAQRLIDVTRESFWKGIAEAKPGNRVGDIGHAVQSYVEENGFSVVRTFVGHGVGKELHEDPEVPNFGNAGRGPRLVPGMCIAIEPMVCQYKYAVKTLKDGWTVKTKDGGLAAHFEHSIAILKDHTEIMTRFWDDPDFDPEKFSLK